MRGWLMLLCLLPVLAGAEEYFLDAAQKRELLMEGQITGRDGARYNVWIVPGYAPPMTHVGKGWRAARVDLAEYGKPGYWPAMLKMTRQLMRYARKDVVRDFALEGSAEAWRESAVAANRRVERRVFGWWFAWPWALVEASAESVVRVGLGVPGGAVLWAGSGVVTPVVYLAWPTGMATGHALGQGTLYPLSAAGWNTLVAPPLALAGQQPAPERADGWWMKRMADPAEPEIRAALSAWRHAWHDDAALAAQREALAAESAARESSLKAMREELTAAEEAWLAERTTRESAYREQAIARALAALPSLRADMAGHAWTPSRLQALREALRAELQSGGVDAAVVERVLNAWLGLEEGVPPAWQQTQKTDPVQQVIQRAPGALEVNP